ncbi:6-bladed beta-propeller [Aromatoleum toluvorans]|uniref:6-bladed beta-propeller n=1 Tax=Aromatoleum toluvorans TaxID=92002 RepID=A0ABX1Q1C6_9RHOO|nr:6-bladed beta-propeller [Aromatoleum toluvorans]NMG45499.1 6-bladed beta-propeller [Aromatoleum toluvorans]
MTPRRFSVVATAFRLAHVLALVAALAGCTGSRPDAPTGPPLVWPPAPETARIAYIRSIAGPADLGITRSLLERMQDLLLGADEARMVRPMAVVAVKGVIYVADPGVQGVHRFDPLGGGYTLVRGPGGTPLPSPVGLAEGAAGDVYVTDSRLARVLVIKPGERTAAPLVLDSPPVQPTGIAFDPAAGHLLVVDTGAHRILVFDHDLRLQTSIGRRGEGPGEFNFPTALWRGADGRLYVTDSLNFRIQIFDADGRVAGVFGRSGDVPGDTPRPKGVATDRDGHIYLVDALLHSLQIFDEAGRFLLPVGQQGRERGDFWLPAGIFVGSDGYIYVADSYNRRVQVLRYLGGAA